MSTRHYFILKKDNRVIFKKQVLGNNDFFDDEFYNKINVKFEDRDVPCQEIQIEDFFVEWVRFLERNPLKNGISLSKNMINRDNLANYRALIDANFYCIQPILLMRKIKKYTFDINDIKLDEYNIKYGKLKDDYKAYIEAY